MQKDKIIICLNDKESIKELIEDPDVQLKIKHAILKDAYKKTKREVLQNEIGPELEVYLQGIIKDELPFDISLKASKSWLHKLPEVVTLKDKFTKAIDAKIKEIMQDKINKKSITSIIDQEIKNLVYKRTREFVLSGINECINDTLKDEIKDRAKRLINDVGF